MRVTLLSSKRGKREKTDFFGGVERPPIGIVIITLVGKVRQLVLDRIIKIKEIKDIFLRVMVKLPSVPEFDFINYFKKFMVHEIAKSLPKLSGISVVVNWERCPCARDLLRNSRV